MENNNIENNPMVNRSGKVWAGLFIIGVGALLLLRNFGIEFPTWLFKWHTLLIVIGLFIGLKHRLKHTSWIVIVLIGAYFTLEDALDLGLDFNKVTLPLMLVVFGLYMILKPKSDFNRHSKRCKRKGDRWRKRYEAEYGSATSQKSTYPQGAAQEVPSSSDYLDSVNVFGGTHQAVYSKNFKGGEVVAVFGGCDLNLTQADFEGTIEIDITAVFGGCKIVIPPGWQVKSEVTAIFGGLDDKRSIQPIVEGQQKLLIIKGVAMFGGVDIRNF